MNNTQKDVYILGIESSCDETAAAVVKNGREVLSNIISSQIVIHRKFGGVVPEIASRKHIENIMPDRRIRSPYRCIPYGIRQSTRFRLRASRRDRGWFPHFRQ